MGAPLDFLKNMRSVHVKTHELAIDEFLENITKDDQIARTKCKNSEYKKSATICFELEITPTPP